MEKPEVKKPRDTVPLRMLQRGLHRNVRFRENFSVRENFLFRKLCDKLMFPGWFSRKVSDFATFGENFCSKTFRFCISYMEAFRQKRNFSNYF
jgi:hypothetical protein